MSSHGSSSKEVLSSLEHARLMHPLPAWGGLMEMKCTPCTYACCCAAQLASCLERTSCAAVQPNLLLVVKEHHVLLCGTPLSFKHRVCAAVRHSSVLQKQSVCCCAALLSPSKTECVLLCGTPQSFKHRVCWQRGVDGWVFSCTATLFSFAMQGE